MTHFQVSEYLKRDNLRTVLDDATLRIGPQLLARMVRDICKGMFVIHKYNPFTSFKA